MQQLHLVGFTTDHKQLILSARKGTKSGGFTIAVDEQLIGLIDDALRRRDGDDGDRLSQHRRFTRQESQLSPREIQSRIRSGSTLAQVAADAGVDEEWVARFAAPILAEQGQVVARARDLHYATPRKGVSSQRLGTSVRWSVADRGVRLGDDDFDSGWSAFQLREGDWVVRFSFTSRQRPQVAEWEVDLHEGTVTARNRLASNLAYVAPRMKAPAAELLASATPPPKPADQDDDDQPEPAGRVEKRTAKKKRSPKKRAAKKTAPARAATARKGTKKSAKKSAKQSAKRSAARPAAKAPARKAKKAASRTAAAKKRTVPRKATKRPVKKKAAKKKAAARKPAARKPAKRKIARRKVAGRRAASRRPRPAALTPAEPPLRALPPARVTVPAPHEPRSLRRARERQAPRLTGAQPDGTLRFVQLTDADADGAANAATTTTTTTGTGTADAAASADAPVPVDAPAPSPANRVVTIRADRAVPPTESQLASATRRRRSRPT